MHIISHAVIIFVDIRGFSAWCEHVNVFQILEEFLGTCYGQLTTVFEKSYIKPLGDGAMIIQECDTPKSETDLAVLLDGVLGKICQMEVLFHPVCVDFGRQAGESSLLRLGWAVTRGFVVLLTPEHSSGISDYVSVDINKCAKLCKKARPAGIVIDKIDFPVTPVFPKSSAYEEFSGLQRTFQADMFQVDGLVDPIAVWASLATGELPTA